MIKCTHGTIRAIFNCSISSFQAHYLCMYNSSAPEAGLWCDLFWLVVEWKLWVFLQAELLMVCVILTVSSLPAAMIAEVCAMVGPGHWSSGVTVISRALC